MENFENLDPKLIELIDQNNFNGESCFYRYTLSEFLTATKIVNEYNLSANPNPSESVINIYNDNHLLAAKDVGAGLAFTELCDDEWKADDRICVKVCLKDILEHGGLIYPVESVIISKTWYFTLPEGKVRVIKV